ncbi:MAG TPA: SDR family oxidoreductase [Thermoanaerobaculia bacterium]|nr:SDR family oxidoreductase [Thermoanaerobaculia bacterium]
MSSEKRSILVTGGTRGIGNAIARRFSREGWSVLISGRTLESVRNAIAAFQREGLAVEGKSCDARKEDDVRELVEFAADRFGRLDTLVNNAGIGIFDNVFEMDPKDFRAVIETNLFGPFYAIRYAAPIMKKNGGGFVVNVGSLASVNAFAGGSAYNASKFGLLGLSDSAMLDLRHDGIRVAIVMPGSVATEFGGQQGSEDSWKLSPEDVAQAVFDLVQFPDRAIPSRIEIRPSRPPKKG